MKKILMILCFALAGISSVNAQIKKVEVVGNYLVVTDTTSASNNVDFEYPKNLIVFKQSADKYITFSDQEGNRLGSERIYHYDSLVTSADIKFTDFDAVLSFLRSNTGFSLAGSTASSTGWGYYVDTQYTDVSPLVLTGGAAYINLPNNKATVIETQKPEDITTFYDGSVITGRDGDGLNITISFSVKPTTNQVTRITVVPDIGGAIGEIENYARDVTFSRGQNVEQRYLSSFNAYNAGTWEANGATLKIRSDQNVEIYNVRYLLTRTHKGR